MLRSKPRKALRVLCFASACGELGIADGIWRAIADRTRRGRNRKRRRYIGWSLHLFEPSWPRAARRFSGSRTECDELDAAFHLCVHVMGVSVSERPVLPGNFHQIDEEILGTQARRLFQNLRHAFEERTLLLRFAAGAHGDLHEDDAVGPGDTEISGVVDQAIAGMFRYDLKAIGSRNRQGFDHSLVNAVGKGLAILGRSAVT